MNSSNPGGDHVTAENPLEFGNSASFHLQANPDWDSILNSESPATPFREAADNFEVWDNQPLIRRRAILVAAYLRHPTAEVRMAAVEASIPFPEVEVESSLVDVLADEDRAVAVAAVQAIWTRVRM